MTEPSTPLMRQYAAIKKQHPNALLFFRLGDFYELFFEDAVVAARELQITLTSRNKEKDHAIPMCGVPYHAAEGYLSKLLRKGFKVAICEQMEDPKVAKKLVRREVTRVMTPGTAIDSSVGSEENNFLAALARSVRVRSAWRHWIFPPASFAPPNFAARTPSVAFWKSCSSFVREKCCIPVDCRCLISRRMNSAEAQAEPQRSASSGSDKSGWHWSGIAADGGAMRFTETPLEDWVFSPDYAIPLVENQFGVLSLEGFGLQGKSGCGHRSRSHSALRPHHAARHAGACGPHRLLRSPGIPGARRRHRPQP